MILVLPLLFVATRDGGFATLGPLADAWWVILALGTVGLSTGITAPDLAPHLKAVLMADMLLGRVEIVAILVLLYPRAWLGRRG